MALQKKIEAFLRSPAPVLSVVGPSGCGKLYATERAAAAAGVQILVVDRAQGTVNYARWGGREAHVWVNKRKAGAILGDHAGTKDTKNACALAARAHCSAAMG